MSRRITPKGNQVSKGCPEDFGRMINVRIFLSISHVLGSAFLFRCFFMVLLRFLLFCFPEFSVLYFPVFFFSFGPVMLKLPASVAVRVRDTALCCRLFLQHLFLLQKLCHAGDQHVQRLLLFWQTARGQYGLCLLFSLGCFFFHISGAMQEQDAHGGVFVYDAMVRCISILFVFLAEYCVSISGKIFFFLFSWL